MLNRRGPFSNASSARHRQTTEQHTEPSTTANASLPDTNFLAFGSSVGVNVGLQRSIKNDIQDIVNTERKVQETLTSERHLHVELAKGRARAERELHQTLLLDSQQTLDSLKVGKDVLGGLKTTIGDEFPDPARPKKASEQPSTDGAGRNLMPSDDATDKAVVGLVDMEEKLTSMSNAFPNLVQELRNKHKYVEGLKSKTNELKKDVSSNKRLVENRERLEATKKENKQQQEVLLQEQKREQSLLFRKEQKQSTVSDLEAKIKELVEKLAAKKKENASVETEHAERVHLAKSATERLQATAANIDAELTELTATKDEGALLLKGLSELVTERESYKLAVENARAARTKVYAEQVNLTTELSAAKGGLDQIGATVVKQQALKKAIEAQKVKNDKVEMKEYLPAKKEADEVFAELEEFKALANTITANKEKEKEKLNNETSQVMAQVEDLKVDIFKTSEIIRKKQKELDEHRHTMQEYDSSARLLKQLEEESETQKKEIQELKELYQERCGRISRAALNRKLEILRRGAAILKSTLKKEKEMDQDI